MENKKIRCKCASNFTCVSLAS